MNAFIADNISSVKLSNEEWLTVIDELDDLVSEHRYAKRDQRRADMVEELAQRIYQQLKNGPVPDPEFPEVEVLRKGIENPVTIDDIPTLD